jgi:hypothetical protein
MGQMLKEFREKRATQPVCIYLFGDNPAFTSLHLRSPVHVVPLLTKYIMVPVRGKKHLNFNKKLLLQLAQEDEASIRKRRGGRRRRDIGRDVEVRANYYTLLPTGRIFDRISQKEPSKKSAAYLGRDFSRKGRKVIKKLRNSRNQDLICLIIEGSGAGSESVALNPDSGGPKTYGSGSATLVKNLRQHKLNHMSRNGKNYFFIP